MRHCILALLAAAKLEHSVLRKAAVILNWKIPSACLEKGMPHLHLDAGQSGIADAEGLLAACNDSDWAGPVLSSLSPLTHVSWTAEWGLGSTEYLIRG